MACNTNTPKEAHEFNEQKVKNQFIKANQLVVIKESDEMDYYQKSHKMSFIESFPCSMSDLGNR